MTHHQPPNKKSPSNLDKRTPIRKILDDGTVKDAEGNYYVNKNLVEAGFTALIADSVRKGEEAELEQILSIVVADLKPKDKVEATEKYIKYRLKQLQDSQEQA
jgi:hypothetical protein